MVWLGRHGWDITEPKGQVFLHHSLQSAYNWCAADWNVSYEDEEFDRAWVVAWMGWERI